jgi:hypothetical protein
MLISDKQQEANRQNAQQSTGPKTLEGKAAVRLNALTYGLRARSTLITGENPEDYMQFWADLEADWQPANRTERLYLETIATSQWLLARIAKGETNIYEAHLPPEQHFPLLREVAKQRAQLERSFRAAVQDLRQSQKERQARPQSHPAHPAQTARGTQPPPHKSADPQTPPPDYVMAESAEAHPVTCSPITPDSR